MLSLPSLFCMPLLSPPSSALRLVTACAEEALEEEEELRELLAPPLPLPPPSAPSIPRLRPRTLPFRLAEEAAEAEEDE
eukprot:255943-Rhodomonas_salina.1